MSDELKLVMELAQADANEKGLVLEQDIEKWQGELGKKVLKLRNAKLARASERFAGFKPEDLQVKSLIKAELSESEQIVLDLDNSIGELEGETAVVKENIADARARLDTLTQGSTVSAQLKGLHLSSPGSRKRFAEGELPNNDVKMSASPGRDRVGWKVDFLIPNGASMIGLRKSMFRLAESHLATEPLDISYQTEQNEAITKSTSMRVMLHFTDRAEASRMLVDTRNMLERSYRADLPLNFEVRSSSKKLGSQVFASRYEQPLSRASWNDVIEPEPSDTTAEGTSRLTIEEIEKETPINPKMFGEGVARAEWAHIKEWSKDNCTHQEGADPSNRLILDPIHHQMYDARGGGDVCGVTFFMDDSDHNTREQTTLHILYANANAAYFSGSLRNATYKSTNHYTVQIQHPEPQELHGYLNARHNRNISENENFKRYLPN